MTRAAGIESAMRSTSRQWVGAGTAVNKFDLDGNSLGFFDTGQSQSVADLEVIPEPSTLLLAALALIGIGLHSFRRPA